MYLLFKRQSIYIIQDLPKPVLNTSTQTERERAHARLTRTAVRLRDQKTKGDSAARETGDEHKERKTRMCLCVFATHAWNLRGRGIKAFGNGMTAPVEDVDIRRADEHSFEFARRHQIFEQAARHQLFKAVPYLRHAKASKES